MTCVTNHDHPGVAEFHVHCLSDMIGYMRYSIYLFLCFYHLFKMEERLLKFTFILITCILSLLYVIGDGNEIEETDNGTGETMKVCIESHIYHLIGDMILGLLRAGLHLLWFYYIIS